MYFSKRVDYIVLKDFEVTKPHKAKFKKGEKLNLSIDNEFIKEALEKGHIEEIKQKEV